MEEARAALRVPNRVAPQLSGRAFGAPETMLDNFLGAVAAVIIEKGKEQLNVLLEMFLKKLVCDDLKLQLPPHDAHCDFGQLQRGESHEEDREKCTKKCKKNTACETACAPKHPDRAPICKVQVLPNTCQLVTHLRADDLLGAGTALLSSLTGDFIHFAVRGIRYALDNQWKGGEWSRIKLVSDLLEDVASAAGDMASGKPLRGSLDAQALLIRLADQPWESLLGGNPQLRPAVTGVRVGLAILARCLDAQACDARAVFHLLQTADSVFEIDPGELEQARKWWPDLDRWILRGLDILTPPRDATPAFQLESAVGMVFELLEHLAYMAEKCTGDCKCAAGCGFEPDEFLSAGDFRKLKALRLVEAIVQGALHSDIQVVLSAAGDLLTFGPKLFFGEATESDKLQKAVSVATRWLGGAASYLSTYVPRDKQTPEQWKAQQQAREKAVRSLLSAAGDRSQRGDSLIFSIGAQFSLIGGGQRKSAPKSWGGMDPQLSLPIGVALQWVPGQKYHVGFHLQLSVLDVAQYAAYDTTGKVTSAAGTTFLFVGVSTGILIGVPKASLFVGLDVRYAPSLFPEAVGSETRSGAFRIGANIGVYVPFFDFN